MCFLQNFVTRMSVNALHLFCQMRKTKTKNLVYRIHCVYWISSLFCTSQQYFTWIHLLYRSLQNTKSYSKAYIKKELLINNFPQAILVFQILVSSKTFVFTVCPLYITHQIKYKGIRCTYIVQPTCYIILLYILRFNILNYIY